MGVIRRDGEKLEVLSHDLHLPRDSSVYVPWKTQLGMMGLQRLQQVSPENSYSFSVAFSADGRTREKIQAMFLALLKEIQPVVKDAKAEEAFQMNFDLFSWTQC